MGSFSDSYLTLKDFTSFFGMIGEGGRMPSTLWFSEMILTFQSGQTSREEIHFVLDSIILLTQPNIMLILLTTL